MVWVESWQFQCCGEDFKVGDTVDWRLKGSSGDWAANLLGRHAPSPVGLLPVVDQLPGDGFLRVGTVVGTGGLWAFVPSKANTPPPPGHPEQWVGQLSEDHHIGVPEDAPTTTALVRRIRLVRVEYHHDPVQQAQVPTPGTATIEDVDPAPRWPVDRVADRRFIGFLVDLDVADR